MIITVVIILMMPLILTFGLYIKSVPIFREHSLADLLFTKDWFPLKGKFGFKPFIMGSLWVSFSAIIISAPVCLLTAIFLTQYAKSTFLKIMHPVIDILAGIPSVVYGAWGVIIVVPFISKYLAPAFGIQSSGYTILAGSIVLSIMIIPFILNILIEIFRSIPVELKEASLSLGATPWETIKFVLVRKAFPGIVSAVGLGLARAFGETMAVLMVVGNVIKIPHGLLDPGYPLPALIANNYGEMLSIPLYDSALMLAALILLVLVLIFNILTRSFIIRLER
jgi:phosphate transport system permease protein